MNDIAIRVENLSKRYRIGLKEQMHDTFAGAMMDFVKRPIKNLRNLRRLSSFDENGSPAEDVLWALRDVSFDVKQGEVVGIIGRNGAGKSTLLKVVSRITEPTQGRVILRGRVSSLLEVGTGFHPELTGRENIYLNGTILGMRKKEIDHKFDQIVDFSEVEKFIDTPVKRYSSGMRVRLAFSVAAHLEPEVLVVDEVLAVGDVSFQKKCLGKMESVAGEGRTVLFVSHNMGAVTRLCPRTILLAHGQAVFDGETETAIKTYLQDSSTGNGRQALFSDDPSLPIAFQRVAITTPNKTDSEPLDVSDPLSVEIEYEVRQDMKGTNIGFSLKRDGIVLFHTWDIDSDENLFELRRKGNYTARLALPDGLLTNGRYSIYVGAGRPGAGIITTHDDCLVFDLENNFSDTTHAGHSRKGFFAIPISWQISRH
jgi:lipopolysaccharide transport system ATP-binding protein